MDITKLLDHRLGMIAVKKGRIGNEEFYRAIKEQKRIFSETKIFTPLADILVNQGVIPKSRGDDFLSLSSSHFQDLQTGADLYDDGNLSNASMPESEEIDSVLELTISDDKLAAVVSFNGEIKTSITAYDIKTLLEEKGIIYGILDDDSINRHIKNAQENNFTLKVASGTMPGSGTADKIKYFFDRDPLRVGTLTDKGTMDWKNRGKVAQVDSGVLLAEIIPGEEGSPGTNIYGKAIPPLKNKQAIISCGKGVEKTEDGRKFYSTEKGQPVISDDGMLEVFPVLKIAGDVGVKTGHIDFDGHVEVEGMVLKGYQVKAKSLRANGIFDADISVLNDIVVYEGIFGANIRNNGSIKAGHIRKSNIVALGNINVETEIAESIIETSGRCVVEETVFASEISAKKGIKAAVIGSESAAPSQLTVGIDFRAKRDVVALKRRITGKKREIYKITPRLLAFKEKSDLLNTKLGDIAQIQDRYIVERRGLLDSPEGDAGRIAVLEKKIREIDATVAGLMGDDEHELQKINETELVIKSCKDKIDELQGRIREINEKSELDKGVAILKASVIYPGTIVKGRHSFIKVEEMLQGTTISERKGTNSKARNPWHMKISNR
jgi:uncharacterized protein (DUF342 family)